MSLKFVLEGTIDDKTWLVQVMAWRHSGAKPLSEPMMTRFTEAYELDVVLNSSLSLDQNGVGNSEDKVKNIESPKVWLILI